MPRGAMLYVTLEPCSTWGRPPPCANAILRAGIRRLVVAATDPTLRQRGRGLRLLRRRGIQVDAGLPANDATALNPAFNHWQTTGRPLVTAKAALILDGKIATRTGDAKWITGARVRTLAHGLRAEASAIRSRSGPEPTPP